MIAAQHPGPLPLRALQAGLQPVLLSVPPQETHIVPLNVYGTPDPWIVKPAGPGVGTTVDPSSWGHSCRPVDPIVTAALGGPTVFEPRWAPMSGHQWR